MLSSFKSKIGNVFCPIYLWGFSNGVSLWIPPYLKLVFLDELQLKIFYRPQQNLASNSKELSQLFSAGLCEKGRSVEVPQLHEYIWKGKREIRYLYARYQIQAHIGNVHKWWPIFGGSFLTYPPNNRFLTFFGHFWTPRPPITVIFHLMSDFSGVILDPPP